MQTGTITRDNAAISYRIAGKGATTLLFVHGSFINQEYWNEQVRFFEPECTVVTLDLPGHGASGRTRTHWSIQGFAEDLNFLVAELELERVILIGHSMGADISLMAATSRPAPYIGFIAVDNFKRAATPLAPEFQQQVAGILERLRTGFENMNEEYARMALLTPQTPREIADRVVQDYRHAYKPMAVPTTEEIFRLDKPEKELLPRLPFPLHLVNVDYLPTNEDALRAHVPNGYKLRHMPGTCHFPMLEDPRQLNTLLQETIREIRTETSPPLSNQ